MGLQKIVVIVGPTASGKSALAIELAKRFDGEIISADSRQVYRGLNIGTGKVTKRETKGIPHYLLDVASPRRKFTAHDFIKRAKHAINEIYKRGKLPIVVGGTGFYIDALVGRIELGSAEPNTKLRERLSKKTAAQLYAKLQKYDRKRARAMNTPSERNNKVRLIRALEIAMSSRGSTSGPRLNLGNSEYDPHWIGIAPKFSELERKINSRLSARLKKGMIGEARRLHRSGLSYKRMEALGLEYCSLARFLQGKISRAELENELQRDIRRYAKKQMSYWKRNPNIRWFTLKNSKIDTSIRDFLAH